MDLEDVGPLRGGLHWLAFCMLWMDVVDPLAVERDHRVSDRSLAAGDEQLFLAVGMEKHQVGARLDGDGRGEVGVESRVDLVAGALERGRRRCRSRT